MVVCPHPCGRPYSHFQYSEVIPDVMGSFVSMTDLNLTYGNSVAVEYGKPIAPSSVQAAPAVTFALEPDRDASTLHTLLMVDPDVPYRDSPTDGEWVHWLVYDIPGNDISRGKTLVQYSPPNPQACAVKEKLCLPEHRVTFVLWEQPHGPLQLQEEDVVLPAQTLERRARYKARDFGTRHRLGLQIGMNFFETSHDAGSTSRPWWQVSDADALSKVQHLIPHVVRPADSPSAKEEL